jgi:hypothetical protein
MGNLKTEIRSNAKNILSKIKEETKFSAYKNYIQKYIDKNNFFGPNYNIDLKALINKYNEKNRGVEVFGHKLSIANIQLKTKKRYKILILFGIDTSIINAKIIYDKKYLQ